MAAQIQYVSDAKGKPVSVIVPIDVWKKMSAPQDDEYTPEQRRAINGEIAKARRGKYYGPFSAEEATRFIKQEIKARRQKAK